MTEQQFRDRVMPHHRLMSGMAMAILGDREDAMDCLQDCLLALWNRRDELEHVDNVKAYCLHTVRNCALSMLRRTNRLETVIPEIDESLDPQTRLEDKDRLAKVMEQIESLPAAQREVIRMSAILDLSNDDVAQMSGQSPGNVRTLLSRARKSLRKFLNSDIK